MKKKTNRRDVIRTFEQRVFKNTTKLPTFRSGDTVRVHYKIQEAGDKFRIQHFEGVVIRRSRGTADGTFTVRKISAGGVGVERVFPIYSPFLAKVEVRATGAVRRSRLYYLRDLSGKAARIKSRFGVINDGSTEAVADSAPAVEAVTSEEQQ